MWRDQLNKFIKFYLWKKIPAHEPEEQVEQSLVDEIK